MSKLSVILLPIFSTKSCKRSSFTYSSSIFKPHLRSQILLFTICAVKAAKVVVMGKFIQSCYSILNLTDFLWVETIPKLKCLYFLPRTTDAQRGNSPHCTAKNSLPLPNFWVRPRHILSSTSAQLFRYLWFMPSLGVRSPCFLPSSLKIWLS